MHSVSLAPRAQLDLESIVLYVGVVLSQPAAARDIAHEIFGTLEKLEEFPLMGEPFENDRLSRNYRRFLVGRYWVYYEVEDDRVIVRRIFHETQELDDLALIDFHGPKVI